MYRLFSMGRDGRLYQLGSQGWARGPGSNVPTLADWRNILDGVGTPPLPDGQLMQDTYIARVNSKGLIMQTYELHAVCEG